MLIDVKHVLFQESADSIHVYAVHIGCKNKAEHVCAGRGSHEGNAAADVAHLCPGPAWTLPPRRRHIHLVHMRFWCPGDKQEARAVSAPALKMRVVARENSDTIFTGSKHV